MEYFLNHRNEKNKGYRNINLHGAAIRDCIQIINAKGGFQLCQASGCGAVIGKLVLTSYQKVILIA